MKIIDTVRVIRHQSIPRLDQIDVSSGGSATDHTHVNKTFLDLLNIDTEERLTYMTDLVAIPLLQEEW